MASTHPSLLYWCPDIQCISDMLFERDVWLSRQAIVRQPGATTCKLPGISLFLSTFAHITAALAITLFHMFIFIPPAFAGPPFVTDDPEPVEYQHWEFYVANQHSHDKDGIFATVPHLEVNYGVLADVQLHLLAPFTYNAPHPGATAYGFSDLELGVKYRFIQETDYIPMVGTFPVLHLPTGNSNRGLGSGETQLLLPIWLQKTRGPWQSYGGGGYWTNPGPDNRNYWFAGWQGATRDHEMADPRWRAILYHRIYQGW
ncbi:MAG: hypothetical protein A4E65_03444 [Syntrophorhabdus sp. PtaU1.Bin153]|nr:MAG: hypothetical protein A4E65_03444 [Syntrophorhabdus sp. PtaU1.Bin153]